MEDAKISPKPLLLAVCVAQFVLPFMMAGVNSVLPSIGESTGASAHELSLLTTFYALGLAIFQLTSGRMGDVWGRRRVFLAGMGIFIVTGSVLGCLNDITPMIVLRFVQGAGGAMFSASSLAILAAAAPPGMRSQYLGLSGAAVYAGVACGPPVAGMIAGFIGWHWLFWGNALAGVLAFSLMRFTVRTEWYQGKGEPFDWQGGAVYGAGMAALTIGSTILQSAMGTAWSLLAVGLVLLVVYVRMELRVAYPLLDVRLLVRNKVFGLSALAAFINYASSFGLLFFFSIYLQVVRGFDVHTAGLFLALQFIIQAGTTPWAGRLADRKGAEKISTIGIALCGVGLCACALLGRDTPLWYLVAAQVLLGLGISLFAIPNTTVLLESAGPEHLGQAAGLTGAVRTGGGLFNMTVISCTLNYYLGNAPVTPENIDAFLQSLRVDLMLFGALNLFAVGCALGRMRAVRKG